MAQWEIETPDRKEAKGREDRERLGDAEYDARIKIAGEKAAELDWKEEVFFKPQFENIALAASDETWAKLREKDGRFWTRLFARLAK